MSVLLPRTPFMALDKGVNELIRERCRRGSEELSGPLLNAYAPRMTGHEEFPLAGKISVPPA